MNLKEAKRLKPGALVRMSYGFESTQGLVLHKQHVKEPHMARCISVKKEERYDIHVQWFEPNKLPIWDRTKTDSGLGFYQNWELMVVSHAPK